MIKQIEKIITYFHTYMFQFSTYEWTCRKHRWSLIILTTETVLAKDLFRICTGSLVCCFPLDALPSLVGSLEEQFKNWLEICTKCLLFALFKWNESGKKVQVNYPKNVQFQHNFLQFLILLDQQWSILNSVQLAEFWR